METNEIYAVRLEKKGVKPTAVRILVLKAMLESPCACHSSSLKHCWALSTAPPSSVR